MGKLKFHIIILLLVFGTSICNAQDQELQGLIKSAKNELNKLGYTAIDEGGTITHMDYVLAFDQRWFYTNKSYFVVAFIKDCYNCYLTFQMWDYKTDAKNRLTIDKSVKGNYLMGSAKFSIPTDKNGRFDVYSNSYTNKFYTYAILFEKTLY